MFDILLDLLFVEANRRACTPIIESRVIGRSVNCTNVPVAPTNPDTNVDLSSMVLHVLISRIDLLSMYHKPQPLARLHWIDMTANFYKQRSCRTAQHALPLHCALVSDLA